MMLGGDDRAGGLQPRHPCAAALRDPDLEPNPHPAPAAERAASVSILRSCDGLGTAATREQTVGDLTAQHADGSVRPAPQNATTDLSCDWIQEEAAAVLRVISGASAADVESGVASMPAQATSATRSTLRCL